MVGTVASRAACQPSRGAVGPMREYALVLVLAMAVTYLLTPIARRLAIAAGALAKVRDRDVHAIATPRWGGLAILGGLAVGPAGGAPPARAAQVFDGTATPQRRRARSWPAARDLPGRRDRRPVGARRADQARRPDPRRRHHGAAGRPAATSSRCPTIGTLSLSPEVSAPITVLFIVVTINAVNFIDGLDGLAAGVVAIAALAFFAYSYHLLDGRHARSMATPTLVTALLAGACLGFLPHNFNPARVFMGDSGSMLIGLVLGGADGQPHRLARPRPLLGRRASACRPSCRSLLPFAVLAVPFVDLGARRAPAYLRPAGRRSAPTSGTCTTGCSRSATRRPGRC